MILSEHTTNSIAHMSTANCMLAIVGERSVINNAQVIDAAFHLSEPRQLRVGKRIVIARILGCNGVICSMLRSSGSALFA